MKRRRFLESTAAVIGSAVLPRVAVSQTPCPPGLAGSTIGAGTPCGVGGDLSLAESAASLAPGQSVQFTPNTFQRPEDVQWQLQTIWYDEQRGELQYMGKPASSQSRDHSHYLYNEDNDIWTDVGVVVTGSGHIWSATFDPEEGDYYFVRYLSDTLRRFRRRNGASLSSWEELARNSGLDAGNIGQPILGWHPSLFGPGRPGLYAHCTFYGDCYDPETNTWSRIATWSNNTPYKPGTNGKAGGQAVYLPGSDRLAVWGQLQGYSGEVIWVEAGAGLQSDALASGHLGFGGETPIAISAAGGSANHGHIVPHPDNPDQLLLLEEHGSSRVWDSLDDGDTWMLKNYTHPFEQMRNWSAGEYTVGVVARYGVVIGMTSDSDGGETVLWKPES